MPSKYSIPKTAFRTARRAAMQVAVGGVAILAAIGTCVWVSRSFQTILTAVTFGGSFWATASLGLCGVALFAWAAVTAAQLSASKSKGPCAVLVVSAQAIGLIALVLANVAIRETYAEFSQLDVFEATALIALSLSLVVPPVAFLLQYLGYDPEDD